jgi:3-oxoacyl-[acyl-carrier protein] reductase
MCSAGTTVHVPFPDLHKVTEEDWDRVMAVNVKGAFLAARAVVPMMRASKGGRIVNVASAAGLTPFYGSSIPYDVSKSGIIMLTKCLARALAPDDILVNAVAPSMMRTSWWGQTPEETLQKAEQGIPLKRAAYVEDVAAGIMYLITNDSTTGHILAIDGGSSMY